MARIFAGFNLGRGSSPADDRVRTPTHCRASAVKPNSKARVRTQRNTQMRRQTPILFEVSGFGFQEFGVQRVGIYI